jgi:radical SAM superfamily enzyme YgiQ (UPF0313 family)
MMSLQPVEEVVGEDVRYNWQLPLATTASPQDKRIRSIWYFGLPLTSAHRGSHSGGGAPIDGAGEQQRYANEGTVYPHAGLLEMITYQELCFPEIEWRYVDLSHRPWPEVREELAIDPPDVIAVTVYTATALWAFIVAAEVKRINPDAVVVFGNDHAGILYREILSGAYGSRIVDFVSTGNNGPFTMMGLLYALQGQLDLTRVPSLAYRDNGDITNQRAPTFPLNRRILPDYQLIVDQLELHYDQAFNTWYSHHYRLKRMVTLPLDAGCNWGRRPSRRCKHCSIQGLTPKTTDVHLAVRTLETVVGELGANVYAAGDSTLGFSRTQWNGATSYLDELAEKCSRSPVLKHERFMLAYGLIFEFLQAAELCRGFVRTWNVGLEAFDPRLLKNNSKGINKGPDRMYEALELARKLDYRLYVSGIMGLPGTTLKLLRSEAENWLVIAEEYQDLITTVSVAAPGIIPGSRMYWEMYNSNSDIRAAHGEILPTRRFTQLYLRQNTDVELADVEAAITEVGCGVMELGRGRGQMKFGGYMLGGLDEDEAAERDVLDKICNQL